MHCVNTCVRGHTDHKGIIGSGDVEIYSSEGHIQCQANVYIGELRLHTKEDSAARAQCPAFGLVEAVGLGSGV
jgi:hypothetical protein